MTEKNDRSEKDFASVQRTALNEAIVLSEIPNIILLTKMLLLH